VTGSDTVVAYLQHLDMLAVQFGEDLLPDGVRHRVLNLSDPVMQIAVTSTEGDVVVYGLSFFQASKHLPKSVLLRSAQHPMELAPARDDPGMLLLPLQPGTPVTARVRADLASGGGIDLLVSRSHKVVGVLVPRDRLPADAVD
jgi:hypothetical protein